MDPLFLAYSNFRRRKFEKCSDICSTLLEKNPYDQVGSVFIISLRLQIDICYDECIQWSDLRKNNFNHFTYLAFMTHTNLLWNQYYSSIITILRTTNLKKKLLVDIHRYPNYNVHSIHTGIFGIRNFSQVSTSKSWSTGTLFIILPINVRKLLMLLIYCHWCHRLKPLFFFICIFCQAAWMLKTRALTEMMYVDEVEIDEQGIAETAMDDNTLAQVNTKFFFFVNILWKSSSKEKS